MGKELVDYLNTQKLMSVATFTDTPWAACVYYVTDNDLNFYFVSPPTSEHAQALEKNSQVACTIYNSGQNVEDKKIGVQLWGNSEKVSGIGQLKWFFKMWAKINPGNKEKINYKNYDTKVISSKVYKITPKRIKFFNEDLYQDEKGKCKVFEF